MFINMLEHVQEMWDGHLGQINTATDRVEVTFPEASAFHAVSYRVGLKLEKLKKGYDKIRR